MLNGCSVQSGYSPVKEIGRQQGSHAGLRCSTQRGRSTRSVAFRARKSYCDLEPDRAQTSAIAIVLQTNAALRVAPSLRGAERRSNLLPGGARLLRFARNDKVVAINAVGEEDDGRDQIRRAFQHPGQRYRK